MNKNFIEPEKWAKGLEKILYKFQFTIEKGILFSKKRERKKKGILNSNIGRKKDETNRPNEIFTTWLGLWTYHLPEYFIFAYQSSTGENIS